MDFHQVSTRIRHFRELRNYTQEYVAGELGITQHSYSRLERDPARINLKRLTKILEVLGISWNDLMDQQGNYRISI